MGLCHWFGSDGKLSNVGWLVSGSKVLGQSDPFCKGIPKLPRPELELGEVATSKADLKKLTGATTAFFPFSRCLKSFLTSSLRQSKFHTRDNQKCTNLSDVVRKSRHSYPK